MGLLPDAEPRPSDPDPADARGSRAGARQGAPALFGLRQRADAGDRPSLPGALFLGRDGRGPPDGGGALCRAEPGAGPSSSPRPRIGPGRASRAHLAGRDDGLVEVAPLLERCGGRFADLIAESPIPQKSPRCAPPRRSAARSAPAPSSTASRADRARPAAGQTGAQEARRGAGRRGGSAPWSKEIMQSCMRQLFLFYRI